MSWPPVAASNSTNTVASISQDFDIHNLQCDEPLVTLLNLPSPYTPTIEHAYLVPVYSNTKWNGYHFWGAAAPYPASAAVKENPCVYVCQDGESWVTPPGVVNPIFGPPATGNYADPTFTFSPDGATLYLQFIWENGSGTIPGGYNYAIMGSSSTDGKTWTTPVVVYGTTVVGNRPDSSSLYWNVINSTWNTIFFAGSGASIQIISVANASPLVGGWSAPATVSIVNPRGRTWWHGHFSAVSSAGGIKVIGTVTDNNSSGGNVFTASSTDGGNTFSVQSLTAFDAATAGGTYYKMSLCMIPDLVRPKFISYTSRLGGMSAAQNGVGWVIQKCNMSLEAANVQTKNAFIRDAVNRQISPGGSVIVYDSFTRTAAVPGTADSGQVWSVTSGTWSTNGTQLVSAATGNNVATLNPGLQDFYIEVQIAVISTSMYIQFNIKDSSNFWRVGTNATSPQLQKIVAGGVAASYTSGPNAFVNGDILAIERRGAYISIYRNGLIFDCLFDSTYSQYTPVALQGAGVTFDNFIVKRGRN